MANNIVNSISSGKLLLEKQLINNRELLIYYSLNDGAGNVARDFSGNGFHGTLVGNPSWVDGKLGKCLSFNGINQYINTNFFWEVKNINMSISLWIKTTQTINAANIISNNLGTSRYFYIQILNSSISFRCQQNTNSIINSHSKIVNDNKWHHIVGVREDLTSCLYIDGIKKSVKANAFSGLMDNSGSIYIGARQAAAGIYFKGLIDEIRFYKRALSSAEVAILYNNT